MKRLCLFPQKTGKYDIEPFGVRLGLPSGERNRNSFFFSSSLKPLDLVTNELSLEVKPLPEEKPLSFSGGVGDYSFKAYIDKRRLSTDDAITMTLTVTGDGDARNFSAPELLLDSLLEVYDANILQSKERPTTDRMLFDKSFEYLIVPKKKGVYRMRPEVTYFSPALDSFITVALGNYKITVSQGTDESSALQRMDELRNIEHAPIRQTLNEDHLPFPWIKNNVIKGILALPFIYMIGLIFYFQKIRKIENEDPASRKFRQANSVASARLSKAYSLLEENNASAFYEEISLALKEYLNWKLSIPIKDINKNNISDLLGHLNINASIPSQISTILNDCEPRSFCVFLCT